MHIYIYIYIYIYRCCLISNILAYQNLAKPFLINSSKHIVAKHDYKTKARIRATRMVKDSRDSGTPGVATTGERGEKQEQYRRKMTHSRTLAKSAKYKYLDRMAFIAHMRYRRGWTKKMQR